MRLSLWDVAAFRSRRNAPASIQQKFRVFQETSFCKSGRFPRMPPLLQARHAQAGMTEQTRIGQKHLMQFDRGSLPEDVALVGVALTGGVLLTMLGVPAGWLTGAMLAVALVGARRPWTAPSDRLIDLGMLLSGVVIGAAATPDAVRLLVANPASLALLLLSMAFTVVATGFVLVRFGGWSRLDALLASAPGALSAVMAVARETGADIPRIAVIQLFRLLLLITVAPSLMVITGAGGQAGSGMLSQPAASPLDTGVMLGAGLAAGLIFRRIGIMSPMILGPTCASALLHATGVVSGTLPVLLAVPGFVIIGAMIGARLGSARGADLKRLLPLAAAAFVASVAVSALFALAAARLAGVSVGVAFIAFAPGGLEAMALLALLLGLDPLFVGAHHMVRFMTVGFALPLLVRLVRPGPLADTSKH
jgi:uncharacterized protein